VIELLQGLDTDPALLFTLRRVKQEDLVARAGTGGRLTKGRVTSTRRVLDESVLGEVFGIDLAASSDRSVNAGRRRSKGRE
jgi:hypothetical protein